MRAYHKQGDIHVASFDVCLINAVCRASMSDRRRIYWHIVGKIRSYMKFDTPADVLFNNGKVVLAVEADGTTHTDLDVAIEMATDIAFATEIPPIPESKSFHDTLQTNQGEPVPARTAQEIELEMLKIAVVNPDLYNNLRQVFIDHKYPEKLDDMGRTLREFFINQKE
jgi:hypothetical protein